MSEGLEGLGGSSLGLLEGELDEDADLATHVNVRGNATGSGLANGGAGDLHVLTDDVNHLGEGSLDGLTVHVAGHEGLDISGLVVANDLHQRARCRKRPWRPQRQSR